MNLKKFYKHIFVFLLSVFVFIGCGSDNGGGEFSKIKLLSPQSKTTVDYSYVTLEVKDSVSDVKAKVANSEYVGVKNGTSFFIYNVPLVKGENKIELVGDGGSEKLTVTVNSEGKGTPPIGLNANKREGFEKLDTTITVQTSLSVNKYLFDKNNDGVTDKEKSSSNFDVSYTQEGRYFPMATVKTSSGVWYSTQKYISLDVKAKPTVEALVDLAGLSVIDMQTFNHEKYYVFAKDNNVYKIDPKTNKIIQTIPVAGVNNAEGFFVDIEENIYIANTGANQIIKLSKADNYQQTIIVDKAGSGDGELSQPKDLVVDIRQDNGRVYVLDAGNNRVQVFDGLGKWLYAFDGSTTPTGKLNNPTSMVGYFAQPLTIVDSGNGAIRTLQCSMNQPESEVSVIKDSIFSNLGKISMSTSIIVPNKINKKILFFNNKLLLEKSIDMVNTAIVAFSNDNMSLIVANEKGMEYLEMQLEPIGVQPIDIAKKFVNALINNDRVTVEKLLKDNQQIIDFLYSDNDEEKEKVSKLLNYCNHILSWEQKYHDTGYATVTTHVKTDTEELELSFDTLNYRFTWYIKNFYLRLK